MFQQALAIAMGTRTDSINTISSLLHGDASRAMVLTCPRTPRLPEGIQHRVAPIKAEALGLLTPYAVQVWVIPGNVSCRSTTPQGTARHGTVKGSM